ncbi:MAG: HAD family hydrolase [bacterium]
MVKIKSVIFDWNGTLVDDVWLSVKVMNKMLEKRGKKPITAEYYKSIFSFPVINYYRELGLDVENEWDLISKEFIDIYLEDAEKLELFQDVVPVIKDFKEKSLTIGIFSAMEHSLLIKHTEHFKIPPFFDFIQGIEDHYAGGKIHLAQKILEKTELEGGEILFVGDTYHDYEVATEIGCQVVLINRGHNPKEKLKETRVPVLNSLKELKDFVFQINFGGSK